MKKVLIIGANGMLGQELANIFKSDSEYKVTAWDFNKIDITDETQVKEKISKLNPEIIINSAAYNAVDLCEKDKAEFAKAKMLNGKAPGYLAKIAKKLDATFVHYSTDYVFSGMPEIPEPAGCAGSCSSCSLHEGFVPQLGFDENAIPEPVQNYGKTKLMGEDAVQRNGEKYYIIRLSKLFGKPAKSKTAKKSFFDVMLEVGKKNKEVKVVDEETSCFTYAPDLAKKTKEIIESEKPYGIFHVSNADACTWYEAVVELYKMTKIKTKVIPVSSDEFPRPAARPYVSSLINTKLNPLRSYKLALREYLKNK
ncbi:MAG: dTDP-4-dehydrorhamnose reductase [Candidatus Moranbacteria bacterium GW2011_GWC2_37_8]|nr:MAG: dTDP-4-dehydrorhamnose reductase [Candidatus Moranbacteria bacterium GW2011_GWC2_37_8]KKQ62284.1 MAG: dTDP-4-dehydrorhamnose reductase [Parcubacteria group bacterium GW2011_GWC1_38_22]KKQ80672.1 MAG: dTDP-4-dehydrorhamnose reductase [Candidatus Moranbacteria bacterium GW2011_GWD2_38_7]